MSAADAHAWPPAWARDLVPAGADVDERRALPGASRPAAGRRALDARDRRAFALVVLASLDSRGGGRHAAAISRRSAPGSPGWASPTTIAPRRRGSPGAAGAARRSRRSSGGPGDYRPFIVDGGFLYHERDLRLEQRLADALAARLDAPPSSPQPRRLAAADRGAAGPRSRPPRSTPPAGARSRSSPAGPAPARRRSSAASSAPGSRAGIPRDAHRDRRAHGQGGQPHRRAARRRDDAPVPAHAASPARLRGGARPAARRRVPPPREPPPAPRRRHRRRGVDGRAGADGPARRARSRPTRAWS